MTQAFDALEISAIDDDIQAEDFLELTAIDDEPIYVRKRDVFCILPVADNVVTRTRCSAVMLEGAGSPIMVKGGTADIFARLVAKPTLN